MRVRVDAIRRSEANCREARATPFHLQSPRTKPPFSHKMCQPFLPLFDGTAELLRVRVRACLAYLVRMEENEEGAAAAGAARGTREEGRSTEDRAKATVLSMHSLAPTPPTTTTTSPLGFLRLYA